MINGIIPLPRENMGTDSLAWGFSTESAYLSTHVPMDHTHQNIFNLARKWKGPERIELFLVESYAGLFDDEHGTL
jgi:hypothetical protein